MKFIAVLTYSVESYYDCEKTFPIEFSSIEDLRKAYAELYRIAKDNQEYNNQLSSDYHKGQEKLRNSELRAQMQAIDNDILNCVRNKINVHTIKDKQAEYKKLSEQLNLLLADLKQKYSGRRPTEIVLSGESLCDLCEDESVDFYTFEEWCDTFKTK